MKTSSPKKFWRDEMFCRPGYDIPIGTKICTKAGTILEVVVSPELNCKGCFFNRYTKRIMDKDFEGMECDKMQCTSNGRADHTGIFFKEIGKMK
jgi:hypothetical protein